MQLVDMSDGKRLIGLNTVTDVCRVLKPYAYQIDRTRTYWQVYNPVTTVKCFIEVAGNAASIRASPFEHGLEVKQCDAVVGDDMVYARNLTLQQALSMQQRYWPREHVKAIFFYL
jgi:hypothetical protein